MIHLVHAIRNPQPSSGEGEPGCTVRQRNSVGEACSAVVGEDSEGSAVVRVIISLEG